MADKFQRQTAYKMQISDILKGKINFEGDRILNVEISGKEVLRVNIIANIVEKYTNPEKQFASLTIDDGSGQIRMKGFSDSFEILNAPMIGDTVYMIGTLKFYNDELYILPEIIKKIIKIHVKVDTGASRIGLMPAVVAGFVNQVRDLKFLNVEGIFSHFSSRQKRDDYRRQRRQRKNFA